MNYRQGFGFDCQPLFYVMAHRTNTQQTGEGQKKIRQAESLLQQAYSLHRRGKWSEAQQAYAAVIAEVPDHAEAMGNLGLLLHSRGECGKAVELYRQAVALSPRQTHLYYFLGNGLRELGSPLDAVSVYKKGLAGGHDPQATLLALGEAYVEAELVAEAEQCFAKLLEDDPQQVQAAYQLGLLFFQQEKFAQAIDVFGLVLALQEGHVDVCFNLALCYKALGQTDEAFAFLKQAEELDPGDTDILYNIGVLHKELGDFDQAEVLFLKALALHPQNGICLTDLAILYHIQNRLDDAKDMYRRALASGYQSESAAHMLSALNGTTTSAAPLQHVRDLFNNYAGIFDTSLVHELSYTIPRQIAQLFFEVNGSTPVSTGLDLGCGTGLAGLAFSGMVSRLTGLDLAENMLRVAKKKQLYAELHCCGIIEFLQTCDTRYDLVLASDVLVYLGELDTFFALVEQVLLPGGVLAFSVETCSRGYALRASGRYAHSAEYIGALADTFHFSLMKQQPAGIRKERGAWIPGELYILTR